MPTNPGLRIRSTVAAMVVSALAFFASPAVPPGMAADLCAADILRNAFLGGG